MELQSRGMDVEARRLLWRCRRGMKELDVLLERYVRSRLPEAPPEERQVLVQLLDLPDPLLADYLLGHATAIDPAIANLVAAIRSPQGARA
jgi:antitoxin CptB